MIWKTILVASFIAAIVIWILVKSVINIKNGKNSCSCGCDGCAMKDTCHKK